MIQLYSKKSHPKHSLIDGCPEKITTVLHTVDELKAITQEQLAVLGPYHPKDCFDTPWYESGHVAINDYVSGFPFAYVNCDMEEEMPDARFTGYCVILYLDEKDEPRVYVPDRGNSIIYPSHGASYFPSNKLDYSMIDALGRLQKTFGLFQNPGPIHSINYGETIEIVPDKALMVQEIKEKIEMNTIEPEETARNINNEHLLRLSPSHFQTYATPERFPSLCSHLIQNASELIRELAGRTCEKNAKVSDQERKNLVDTMAKLWIQAQMVCHAAGITVKDVNDEIRLYARIVPESLEPDETERRNEA